MGFWSNTIKKIKSLFTTPAVELIAPTPGLSDNPLPAPRPEAPARPAAKTNAKVVPDYKFAGNRKALLVGINAYGGANTLQGCVMDCRCYWNRVVKEFDYDCRVVIDARATLENILHRFDLLCSETDRGDQVAFIYSGHGSRVRDRDGDELVDQMDECLCPVDMTWDYLLLDDLLAECLAKLHPQALAWLVFDCCHSGSMSKNPTLGASVNPVTRPTMRNRYIAPPFDIEARGTGAPLPLNRLGKTAQDAQSNVICLSACRDNQTAAEANLAGEWRGAFSYYLLNVLGKNPTPTAMLMGDIADNLKINGFAQLPVLTAPKELENLPFLGGPRP